MTEEAKNIQKLLQDQLLNIDLESTQKLQAEVSALNNELRTTKLLRAMADETIMQQAATNQRLQQKAEEDKNLRAEMDEVVRQYEKKRSENERLQAEVAELREKLARMTEAADGWRDEKHELYWQVVELKQQLAARRVLTDEQVKRIQSLDRDHWTEAYKNKWTTDVLKLLRSLVEQETK